MYNQGTKLARLAKDVLMSMPGDAIHAVENGHSWEPEFTPATMQELSPPYPWFCQVNNSWYLGRYFTTYSVCQGLFIRGLYCIDNKYRVKVMETMSVADVRYPAWLQLIFDKYIGVQDSNVHWQEYYLWSMNNTEDPLSVLELKKTMSVCWEISVSEIKGVLYANSVRREGCREWVPVASAPLQLQTSLGVEKSGGQYIIPASVVPGGFSNLIKIPSLKAGNVSQVNGQLNATISMEIEEDLDNSTLQAEIKKAATIKYEFCVKNFEKRDE